MCTDMILCDRCIAAIRSRGEKVHKLESLYYEETEAEELPCEWCGDLFPKDELFKCIFPA